MAREAKGRAGLAAACGATPVPPQHLGVPSLRGHASAGWSLLPGLPRAGHLPVAPTNGLYVQACCSTTLSSKLRSNRQSSGRCSEAASPAPAPPSEKSEERPASASRSLASSCTQGAAHRQHKLCREGRQRLWTAAQPAAVAQQQHERPAAAAPELAPSRTCAATCSAAPPLGQRMSGTTPSVASMQKRPSTTPATAASMSLSRACGSFSCGAARQGGQS